MDDLIILTGAEIIDELVREYIAYVDEEERKTTSFTNYNTAMCNKIDWNKKYVTNSKLTFIRGITI